MEITKNQLSYLSSNLFVQLEDLRQLTKEEASKLISSHKAIYRETSDVMQRHYALQRLSNEVTERFHPRKCTVCHKPLTPVNTPATCSC